MPRKTGQPDIGESTMDRTELALQAILGENLEIADPDPSDLQSDE